MALKFTTLSSYAAYTPYDFLSGATKISVFVRCKFGSSSYQQAVVSHRSSGPQFNIRRLLGSPSHFKITLTAANGASCYQEPSSPDVQNDTVYDVAFTWEPGQSAGFRVWIDGVEKTPASTTSQSGSDYTHGTGSTLHIARLKTDDSPLMGGIESLLIMRDYLLQQADIDLLREHGHPFLAHFTQYPHSFYSFDPDIATLAPDYGSQLCHITTFAGTVVGDGYYGQWLEDYIHEDSAAFLQQTTAPPPSWIDWGSVSHPTNFAIIGSLDTEKTYEFRIRARDAADNCSSWTDPVEASPRKYLVHIPRYRFFGHA